MDIYLTNDCCYYAETHLSQRKQYNKTDSADSLVSCLICYALKTTWPVTLREENRLILGLEDKMSI
jgi:hypothetical protein